MPPPYIIGNFTPSERSSTWRRWWHEKKFLYDVRIFFVFSNSFYTLFLSTRSSISLTRAFNSFAIVAKSVWNFFDEGEVGLRKNALTQSFASFSSSLEDDPQSHDKKIHILLPVELMKQGANLDLPESFPSLIKLLSSTIERKTLHHFALHEFCNISLYRIQWINKYEEFPRKKVALSLWTLKHILVYTKSLFGKMPKSSQHVVSTGRSVLMYGWGPLEGPEKGKIKKKRTFSHNFCNTQSTHHTMFGKLKTCWHFIFASDYWLRRWYCTVRRP